MMTTSSQDRLRVLGGQRPQSDRLRQQLGGQPLLCWLIGELQRLRATNAALGAENAVLHHEVQDLLAQLDQAREGRLGGVA